MNITDIITVVFSSTLLTAIITSFFNLFINKNKNSIENITKERKIWRDEMRKIALSISKSENIKELKIAISELKVRINAYGIVDNSVFSDTHIWEHIFIVESQKSFSSDELDNIKKLFVNQISCILKYDWERAKTEIKGNTQMRIVIFSLAISFLMYSLRWFYYYYIGVEKIINFLSYLVFFIILSVFFILMIILADKWKNKVEFYSLIFGVVIVIVSNFLIYIFIPSASPYDLTDWIISLAPCITFIYAFEAKFLLYKRNMSLFILATALSCGANKIHKKYRIFFKKKDYTNLFTGEGIVFEEFEEIIAVRSAEFGHTLDDTVG